MQMRKDCPQGTNSGKNLKSRISFSSSQPLSRLQKPNEEVQLAYAGPLKDNLANQMCILVAINRFSKYPSAMLTRSTEG